MIRWANKFFGLLALFTLLGFGALPSRVFAADKLVGIFSARVMSQSMPRIAQEAGLFHNYNLATTFATGRSIINRRPQVVGAFMRAMAEAAKILHKDKEFTYRVLAKQLRVDDRKVLEVADNAEIRALEARMEIKLDALQAMLDEVAPIDPRAKNIKPQELFDRR